MAGPRLEVFKFALYLFVPISCMMHYAKPEWYTKHVLPYKDRLFPPLELTNRTMPVEQAAIRAQLEAIKAQKLAKRLERESAGEPAA